MDRVIAYLGLGSNLGSREENLATAISLLRGAHAGSVSGQTRIPDPGIPGPGRAGEAAVEPLRASSVYETEPWGYVCQPKFLNCVLEVLTSLTPQQLLESVKGLEEEMGRRPGFRYGPRLIDVDILLYGGISVELPGLQVPHPRLHQRAFALIPLAELAPDAVHPVLQATIGELAAQVEGRAGVSLWGSLPGRPV